MRIYMDNCCFNRPYDEQTNITNSLETQAKLVIQELIKSGRYDLVSSEILEYEINASPYIEQSAVIRAYIGKYASFKVGEKRAKDVEAKAAEIMKTGVKYKDALHVASAIIADCEYFISVDKRLLKYDTDEIKLVNPIAFVSETEGK